MKYNLSDPTQVIAARSRVTYLVHKQSTVEIREVNKQRTIKQNSYLHLLIGLFALETGYKLEEAKIIYKRQSPDLYVYRKHGEAFLRSSTELTTKDMGISIDRFRAFAAEQGIDLPAAMSHEEMIALENQIEKNRRYL